MIPNADDWRYVHYQLSRLGIKPGFNPGQIPTPDVIDGWERENPGVSPLVFNHLNEVCKIRVDLERSLRRENIELYGEMASIVTIFVAICFLALC